MPLHVSIIESLAPRKTLQELLASNHILVVPAEPLSSDDRSTPILLDATGHDATEALQSLDPHMLTRPLIVLADTPPQQLPAGTLIYGWLVAPSDDREVVGAVKAFLGATTLANGSGAFGRLRQAERERSELELADAKKDEFISHISHELKNPMASIKGYSDLMRRRLSKTPDDPNLKGVEIISTQVGRMVMLLDQMLDFSRISMDRLQLDMHPFQLEKIAEQLIDEFQSTTRQHALQIVADDHPVIVRADQVRLRQALQYLIANAMKFSPEAGTIVVSVTKVADGAQVAIRDRGVGIPVEERGRIFERFYRASNVDPGTAGVGLGLFLAREIIERHGGKICVESELGQGSTFTVWLPEA